MGSRISHQTLNYQFSEFQVFIADRGRLNLAYRPPASESSAWLPLSRTWPWSMTWTMLGLPPVWDGDGGGSSHERTRLCRISLIKPDLQGKITN